jgi:chromosome segregation ATPase
MIPTREEFEKLLHCAEERAMLSVYDALAAQLVVANARIKKLQDALTIERTTTTNQLDLLRAKDKRIAELEEESATWEKSSVAALVARRAEQDRRISMLETELGRARDIIDRAASCCQHFQKRATELEAALEGLLNHTKNNQQICGLNDRARAALHKEGK